MVYTIADSVCLRHFDPIEKPRCIDERGPAEVSTGSG
jgi:hypothetical protein